MVNMGGYSEIFKESVKIDNMTREEREFSRRVIDESTNLALLKGQRELIDRVNKLKEELEIVDNAADYWKGEFEALWNEVNEHGVLADVLQKWDGESDELNKINRDE